MEIEKLKEEIKKNFPVEEVNGKLIKWHGKDIQMIMDNILNDFEEVYTY